MRARRSSQLQGWLFTGPALLFVALFVLVPLGQLVDTSLTDRSLLGGGRFVGFDNYLRIWRDASFWRALAFTAQYTIVLTPILMGLGYALALLTFDNTPLKRLTRTIVFVPVIIGLSSSSLLWFWLLRHYFTSRLMLLSPMTPLFTSPVNISSAIRPPKVILMKARHHRLE